jgi:non-ribosomal peptide synthetase component F
MRPYICIGHFCCSLHWLEILDPGERHTLVEGFNATARPISESTLPELFEAQAARRPEGLAVVCGQEQRKTKLADIPDAFN